MDVEKTAIIAIPETEESTTETSVSENPTEMDGMCKIIAEAFPEDELKTPEECQEKLTTLLASYKKEREAIKIIDEAFQTDPRLAAAIQDWSSGKRKTVIAALAGHFDQDEFMPSEGEPEAEEMQAAISERMANKKSMQGRLQELDTNLEESRANIESFMADQGLTTETIQPFIQYIDKVHKAFYDGKLTKVELTDLWKGYNRDADVQTSYNEGRNDMMNEKIVEKKMTSGKTDNIPNITAASEKGTVTIEPMVEGVAQDWRRTIKSGK